MADLTLATNNSGKLRELRTLLFDRNIRVRAQAEFVMPKIAETGLSFVENAIIKARNAAYHSQLPALADDSGLAVDALHGKPGIRSARYAGPSANDHDNIVKLLSDLSGIPTEQRNATFHCVLVYLSHAEDPTPLISHGQWHGRIADEPRGSHGFGYDPIFIPEGTSETVAELTTAEKQRLSHRARALAQLLEILPTVS